MYVCERCERSNECVRVCVKESFKLRLKQIEKISTEKENKTRPQQKTKHTRTLENQQRIPQKFAELSLNSL